MDSMDRTAWNGRSAPARLFALCAVVVGLLTMHGLASSHHGPAAAAPQAGPAVAASHVAEAGPAGAVAEHHVVPGPAHHSAASTGAPAPRLTGPLATPTGPSCAGDCPAGLVVLCVAVLAAAAVAVAVSVLLRRRARLPGAGRAVSAAQAPTTARLAPPPPDPVRELCVSRT